jgi:transcriptional regulator with XRE-family HTH domain
MRQALADRDIGVVYSLLRDAGISQRRIADLVGQTQSEVSEILGGRSVRAYDVLVRVADGLGVPREYLGLAHVPAYGGEEDEGKTRTEAEAVKRRRFLTNAAAVVVGYAVFGAALPTSQPRSVADVPNRVGAADVQRLRATTVAFRQLDYQHGGGACQAAAAAQVREAERLFSAVMTDDVRKSLHAAVADLHNVVGWTSFDSDLLDHSRYHFSRGIEHAKQADDPAMCAFLLCRMGHVYLFNDAPDEALKLFQLAELPAAESGLGSVDFVTSCYQARAYADLADSSRAEVLVGRAEDVYARDAEQTDVPHWLAYFRAGGANSVRGGVYTALSDHKSAYLDKALEAMRAAVNDHRSELERGNLMDLGSLATLHLRSGNINHGLRLAANVVGRTHPVASVHLRRRLRPLARAAERCGDSTGRDIARAVDELSD